MKVGEYVRVKVNDFKQCTIIISKIKYFAYNNLICIEDSELLVDKKDIIKSSPNIIDLIEAGDYINGLRVEENKYGELYTSYVYYGGDIGKQCEVYTTWLEKYKENEDYIDNILTKEQFEAMEYKVGDNK